MTKPIFSTALAIIAISAAALCHHANADLIPSADGLTVYDTFARVTWLANANLPETEKFGISGINSDGSMNYATALAWVGALNAMNGGAGYLGHNTWTLPTTPFLDSTCNATGPTGGNFGFNCQKSAMGSLYNVSLAYPYPDTVVPTPNSSTGPFANFQPYLYWSATAAAISSQGYRTFSFNTGWQGSNINHHYMYVLPMIPHALPGTYHPAGMGSLQVSADGKIVYDPSYGVTWLTDANLALSRTFGAQCVDSKNKLCINSDGSMSHDTALNWIAGMNAYRSGTTIGWLGQTDWQLPPTVDPDPSCNSGTSFNCIGSPMGELFYTQFRLGAGTPIVATPNTTTGPFRNIQPYLYWSCGEPATSPPCQTPPPASNFEWSFSFGNGFEGTDLTVNELYVMVYWPDRIFADGFEP